MRTRSKYWLWGMKGLPIILCFELYYRSWLLTWPFISIAFQSAPCAHSTNPVWYIFTVSTSTEKFTPVTSFAYMEICCVLGHFSSPSDLAVRRLCCFLWSKESKVKLSEWCKENKQAKHDSYGSCHLYFCRLFFGLSTFLSLHRALVYEGHFVLCIRRKLEPLDRSCQGKFWEVIGLHDFRCYLRVPSLSLTPL